MPKCVPLNAQRVSINFTPTLVRSGAETSHSTRLRRDDDAFRGDWQEFAQGVDRQRALCALRGATLHSVSFGHAYAVPACVAKARVDCSLRDVLNIQVRFRLRLEWIRHIGDVIVAFLQVGVL